LDAIPYLAGASALMGLLLAWFFYTNVKAASPGDERMVFLMTEIQKGARAFLKKEYSWVSVFVVVMAVLIAALIAPAAAVTYVIGAFLSGLAGYVGMTVATMANARTTEAAKDGPGRALPIAFRGGAVMGFTVAGLALLGLMFVYVLFVLVLEVDDAFEVVTAYGLGASSIALFSRVGGGIYTKAADVGADLVANAAPNLTHLMSRTTFAGGIFDLYEPDGSLNRTQLEAWLRNAPAEKPAYAEGRRGMPAMGLSEGQIDDVVAYLQTLGARPDLGVIAATEVE